MKNRVDRIQRKESYHLLAAPFEDGTEHGDSPRNSLNDSLLLLINGCKFVRSGYKQCSGNAKR